ncbi:hypothetical protein [Dickeya sp. NCPPB 3274]|uniref:hypothetical protein n=1 Tax=Dickeya sp. NCPPB 3274 TaxID=568766 RepID=UPI00187C74AB|nr:hypothetical protein [Dickeya sp. NCPPB 3274]
MNQSAHSGKGGQTIFFAPHGHPGKWFYPPTIAAAPHSADDVKTYSALLLK